MKIIKYNISTSGGVLMPVEIQCTADALEANIAIVEKEAYNGEYENLDDGQVEAEEEPTTEERLTALEESNVEMEEAIEMLLLGVTE